MWWKGSLWVDTRSPDGKVVVTTRKAREAEDRERERLTEPMHEKQKKWKEETEALGRSELKTQTAIKQATGAKGEKKRKKSRRERRTRRKTEQRKRVEENMYTERERKRESGRVA